VVRVKDFNDVDLYFGQVYDKILEPGKLVKGNSLDIWILEKISGDLVNFNNLGIFVKRLQLPETLKPVSIAYSEDNLVILFNGGIFKYNLKGAKFSNSYFLQQSYQAKDINMLDKETLLVLSKQSFHLQIK
jgi:hypothetical protein